MKIGLLLLLIGALMVLYAYFAYRKASKHLARIREEDLVSYYLDLAIDLLPLPLWIGLIGIVFTGVGLIVIIIHIPLVL